MKRCLCIFCCLFFSGHYLISQDIKRTGASTKFVAADIFQTGYFIGNKGQFDAFGDVKYGVDNKGDHFYFTPDGFTCDILKENFRMEGQRRRKAPPLNTRFSMQWLGANPNPVIEAQQKSGHYFTYGGEEYNSYGYKKIIYRELYPGVDVEYEIPEQGGIKYAVIVKPGSDLKQVKFKYTGEQLSVSLWENRLLLDNPVHDYAEDIPVAFEESGKAVKCRFKIQDGLISFETGRYNSSGILIIDPWIAAVTTLTSSGIGNNRGFDVDFDYAGNLYVYGGSGSQMIENPKIAKYDLNGNLLWTFSGQIVTPPWQSSAGLYGTPSNFVVEKNTGRIYTGQAYNSTGTQIVRLKTTGTYDNFISTQLSQFQECWDMTINCSDPSQLGVVGGGTNSPLNIGWVDTSTATATINNFTGSTAAGQDIANIIVDNNKFGYVIFGGPNGSSLINYIFKLQPNLTSSIWTAYSGYSVLQEGNNHPFLTGSFTGNGMNILAANNNYIFYYDGLNLKAFNRTTGAAVGTSTSVTGNLVRYQCGIYADECDNVYVGGASGQIKVYFFNGASFSSLADIVIGGAAANKHVHDIRYHSGNNLIYVSGEHFVATLFPSVACSDSAVLDLQLTTDCTGNATAEVLNPDLTATYTFIWRDSTTGVVQRQVSNVTSFIDNVTGLVPGVTYSITAIKNALCGGASAVEFFRISGAATSHSQTIALCSNQTYNGQYYPNDTTLVDTITTGTACDSIITTMIDAISSVSSSMDVQLCPQESYLGQVYTNDTTLVDTLAAASGCDSIVSTHIDVIASVSTTQNVSLCRNQAYNGQYFTTDTTLVDSLAAANGCDSIVYTEIDVITIVSTTQNVSVCNNELYNGQYFSADTTLADTLAGISGCDSIAITEVHVLFTSTSSLNVTICSIEPYNGQIFTRDTVLIQTLSNADGCDSVASTQIYVLAVSSSTTNVTTCSNQPYQGQLYTSDTALITILPNANGCDSTATTNITVLPAFNSTANVQLCSNETYNGQYYLNDTTLVDSLAAVNGCDSVLITQIDVVNTTQSTQNVQVCNNELYNGQYFSTDTTLTDTLANSSGCDSITITQIHVLFTSTPTTQSISICSNEPYNGQIFTRDTVLTQTLSNTDGCDSVASTQIYVLAISSSTTNVTTCSNQPYQGQLYSNDTTLITILPNANGCDSTITTNITVLQVFNSTTNVPLCENETYLGQYFTQDTTWIDSFISLSGCDSVLTTAIRVLPVELDSLDETVCFRNGYTLNGIYYDASGTYSASLVTSAGCDSLVTLNLTVLPDIGLYAVPDSSTVEIGEGISVSIHNNPLASVSSYDWLPQSGVDCPDCPAAQLAPLEDTRYTVMAMDAHGCRDTVFIPIHVTGPVTYIPNVFTPNSDGTNDFFEFYGSKNAISFFNVKIFDRWGEKVYESYDKNFKWDGIYREKLLNPAVFVYEVQVTYIGFPQKLYKGSVTLLK